jgi:hypothetical protein
MPFLGTHASGALHAGGMRTILSLRNPSALRDSQFSSNARFNKPIKIDLFANLFRRRGLAFFNESCAAGIHPASVPSSFATLSMCRSSAKMLCGAPNPRNAPCGGKFVATALLCMRTFGQK